MCHGLQWFIHLRAHVQRKGDHIAPTYALHAVYSTSYLFTRETLCWHRIAMARCQSRTAWMDQHRDVDRTPVEDSIRMIEDRDKLKWRKYVHGVANRRIKDC